MFRHRHRFIVPVLSLLAFLPASVSHAAGMWNGQDILHVPISWCIVQGSPAEAAPNVAGDTTTDALIWRRHERPTDEIYDDVSGISFRSAINTVWGSGGLSFPIIPDPDTTFGVPGDMRGEDVNVFGAEFNQMQNDCDVAWANLGQAGLGITAVNAGLFHNGAGNYVGIIGWGGCVQNVGNPGVCITPYDGVVTVIDNHYLFPTVPDRTFPDGSGNQFVLTDPFDALTGHEFGHAMSLPHRNSLTALMNPGMVDNNGDGQTDNIGLNSTEVAAARAAALLVNGLEIDPPNVFLPGTVVAANLPDPKRNRDLPAHLDLSALRATLDTQAETFSLGQRLFGLVPEAAAGQSHWFLIDNDGPTRGATADQLRSLGVPETDFPGADVVIRADVKGPKVTGGAGWRLVDGQPKVITPSIKFDLLALVMHPHFAALRKPGPIVIDQIKPVHHIVSVSLPASLAGVSRGQAFNVHALVENDSARAADRLDSKEGRGTPVKLDFPSFPHCFPQGKAQPGGTVKVDFDGLAPSRGYHALLGARMAGRGMADLNGGGSVSLEIPKDTAPGLHLVTIGTDLTALTADCTVIVEEVKK